MSRINPMWGSARGVWKKSERRSSTFFCIPNLQSRLISSFGMQLIAAVNSTNWKIVVTLFMFLIGRTQLLSNSMLLTSTVENDLSKTYNKIQVEFPNCAHIYFDNQLIFAKLWSHFFLKISWFFVRFFCQIVLLSWFDS